MKFHYAIGSTPYNQDEKEALIPKHITTQKELDEWEELNILKAQRWLFARKHKNLLSLEFFQKLHQKMFDKTWKWAGKWRQHNTNIGVEWPQIPSQLLMLLGDVKYWQESNSISTDEATAMLHHRLVQIHPFSNGNGRFSRLISDAFLVSKDSKRFTWGAENLVSQSETRTKYINALKEADKLNYQELLDFVRS